MMRKTWLGLGCMVALCVGAAACGDDSEDAYGGGEGQYGSGGGAGRDGTDPGPTQLVPSQPEQEERTSCEGVDDSKPLTLYLSADDSNSMASPAHARELLRGGMIPYGNSIRTYEFLNYYRIDFPAPEAGSLGIHPQAALGDEEGTIDLQIGVRAPDQLEQRRPMTITFVLDTSGSMSGEPIARERATVLAVAEALQEGDIVNAVTWNTSNNVVMAGHVVSGANDPAIVDMANSLGANGGTDLHGGLTAGYDLAQQHYGDGRINRVVLVSDGGANVGVTSAELIGQHSDDADEEGIYLVGVGTGPAGGYSDALMDVVTDAGRGAYVYLDSEEEAQLMFRDRFSEVFDVSARAVQLELTVPWYFQMHRFYGEEYSEDPEEVDPQHLAPGDAMVFSQVLKACDATIIDESDSVTITARWQSPLSRADKEDSLTTTVGELLDGPKDQLEKGSAIVAYAEALKAGDAASLQGALDAVNAANASGLDQELSQIATLLEGHPGM